MCIFVLLSRTLNILPVYRAHLVSVILAVLSNNVLYVIVRFLLTLVPYFTMSNNWLCIYIDKQ